MLNTDLNIRSTGCKLRIDYEVSNLRNQCKKVSTEQLDNGLILLQVLHNSSVYEFSLQPDYPFKIPSNIRYNGVDYKKWLLTAYSEKTIDYLKRFYFMDCLCCNTFECLWTPVTTISHIINEINKISRIKKEIMIRMICDFVRFHKKCVFDFANFEQYLF
jgi:hypothetical protein